MTYTLTNDEKLTIINQHLRTLAFSKYNIEMSLLEENSVEGSRSSEVLLSLQTQLADVDAKIEALVSESNALAEAGA